MYITFTEYEPLQYNYAEHLESCRTKNLSSPSFEVSKCLVLRDSCVVLPKAYKSDINTYRLYKILWRAPTLRKTSPNFNGVVDHALEVWSFFVLSFETRVID